MPKEKLAVLRDDLLHLTGKFSSVQIIFCFISWPWNVNMSYEMRYYMVTKYKTSFLNLKTFFWSQEVSTSTDHPPFSIFTQVFNTSHILFSLPGTVLPPWRLPSHSSVTPSPCTHSLLCSSGQWPHLCFSPTILTLFREPTCFISLHMGHNRNVCYQWYVTIYPQESPFVSNTHIQVAELQCCLNTLLLYLQPQNEGEVKFAKLSSNSTNL